MKQLLTILSALVCSLAAAAPISQQQATLAARNFLGSQNITISLPEASLLQTEDPELYVFNREGGGYVIISGDDAVEPVLGYSDKGKIDLDNLNPTAEWWLGIYREQIRYVRSSGARATAAIQKKWAGSGAKGSLEPTPVVEHKTADWDQGSPYNTVCCSKVGSGVFTGCVATAAAIVCRYFQWPESGTGTTASYKTPTDYYTVPSVTLGHSYDYSQMPLTNAAGWTSAQINEVATLMFELGAMSYTDYSAVISGTYTSNIAIGLAEYMHYNKQAVEQFRVSYSDEDWIALLKQQLGDHGPLIYGGTTSSIESHQFVMDGYDSNDCFHINWGWGGDENGWFQLSSLGKSYKFNSEQSVITDLFPDRQGSSEYRDFLVLSPYETFKGISTTSTSFKKNTTFICKVGDLYNGGSDYFTGKVYVAVYDKSGKWKENVSSPIAISNWQNLYLYHTLTGSDNFYQWSGISCRITEDINGGDRLRVHYEGKHNEGYAMMDTEDGVWEIEICRYTAAQIASATSLSYERATKKLTLICKYDITGKMKKASSEHEFFLYADKPCEIDLSDYGSGTWELVLNGGTEDLSIPITL